MSSFKRLLVSSIGRKLIMATTGLLLFIFLIAHLTGNMLIFRSAESFNEYSHTLISNPLIYAAEIGLLILFGLHLISGILVTAAAKKARPHPYTEVNGAGGRSRRSLASRTMIISGVVILLFVPWHIWTFKYGPYYPSVAIPDGRDLYRLVLEVFKDPVYVVGYVLAMLFIGSHLWHAFASAFESLGFRHRPLLRSLGHLLAVIIAGGFLSIPVIIYVTGGTW